MGETLTPRTDAVIKDIEDRSKPYTVLFFTDHVNLCRTLECELATLRTTNAQQAAQIVVMQEALKEIDNQLSIVFWTSDDGLEQRKGEPEDAPSEKLGLAWANVIKALDRAEKL